jgi:hypothetical protein
VHKEYQISHPIHLLISKRLSVKVFLGVELRLQATSGIAAGGIFYNVQP